MIPDHKQPVAYLLWLLGLFIWAMIIRLGWEFGGVIWRLIP